MAPKRRQSPTTVRDAVGMTIPEARLRRDRISYERFDEEVGQASRDLLGVEELAVDVEEPSLRTRASSIQHDGGVFGAHYDRRFIRYQGTAEDAERVCAHSPNPTEVATNKLLDGESSGSSYRVMKSAVHADTAQGGSRDARAYVRDAASTNATQTEGAMTMARHFARAERGEAYASIARAGQRMTLPEMVEPASARPTGRKESQRTAAMDAPEQHPCRLQCTVCASAAGRRTFATVCPHLRDSEVCCLEQLKRGVCRRHLQGCCPWHHGSGRSHALMHEEALIPDRDWNETASSMKDDDEGRTSQNYIRRTVPERLQAGAPWIRTLLQLFVDAFLTVLQRGDGEAYEAFMAASTAADRVRILMESINPLDSVSLGEEEVLYQVTMDTGLNVCVVPWTVARHAVLNEDSTETESEMLQHFANDDVPHLWSSYLISVNGADNKGGSPCVGLSPLLYDWVVEAVRITAITSTLSSSPLMSASSFLMRRRWEHVNARRREENSMHGGRHAARVQSGDHIHEWAPLLLLQDCLRWRHLPADESTAGEASMLSALVLQHEEATETLPCRHATERWDRSWSKCHRFMLTLADALHQYPSAQYGSITAFVQPALVHLATHLASTQVAPHEEALRQAAGWQAWTTEQMCSPAHQAYFTPARYARHHLPFVYSALLNSLLNGLLLLSLRRTSVRCSMDECSPVVDALMSRSLPYTATLARDVAAGAPTVRRYAAQQVLSRCTPVSLRYLAALQELSVHVEQQRVELSEEFKSRHRTYHQERESSARHTHMKRRTYHDLQDRLSELLENSYASVPMIDRLLPHGTVAVCPEATAMLLRQLVDYAGYRALKLASSIIHASRMLRHAAKRPLPQLVEGEKTVHRSMRNKKTMRTHAVPVRVRTWYIKHGMGEEKGSGSAVRPLGLAYPITETVMEALVRVGLCMGDAGAKLADGVREDCVAGSLVDHAEGRVLPMLTSEAVEGYCNTHPAIAPGTGIASTICHLLLDPPVDDDGALPAGRRIPPTSGLVELCVLYTSPTDSTRQTRYRGLLRQDLTRFGTPPVLVAQQYAVMRSGRMGLVRQAILAAHTAWVQCLASMPALTQAEVQWCASLQSEVRQTRGEVEELLSQQDRVQSTSSVAAVSSTEDLKKFLRGEGEGAATTEGPSGPSRSFPYAGLMVSTAAQHRHGRSRLMAILALSTGGLLGLGEEALSTREGDVTSYARLLLRNAFVTAELLLPTSERGQRVQDPRLMVVRSLLHAGVWAGEVVDDGVRGTERTAATAVARPFHAALSGIVLSAFLRRQLSLQLTLCGRDAACGNDALLEQLSRSLSPQPTADGNEDGTMAGQLFSSLCAHPAVATRWLSHTLLSPSAELLLWIATRLPDRDASAAQTMSLWVDAVRQRRQLSQDEGEEDSQMMELVVRRLEDIQKRRPRGLPS